MNPANRSLPSQLFATLATTFVLAGTATAAGLGVNVQADAGVQAAPASAQAGGRADAHMNPAAAAHGNAQWQDSATRGAERAGQVRSKVQERSETAAQKSSAELEAELTGAASVSGGRPGR
ncbi:MAG: hypothetical protein AB1418_12290 [Pseudomonadota bacterium]